jgi:hypothetical protein
MQAYISFKQNERNLCAPLSCKLEEFAPKLSEYSGNRSYCLQFNILTYYLKLDWVFLSVVLDADSRLVRGEGSVVVAGNRYGNSRGDVGN